MTAGWLSCDCWSYDEPTRVRTKSNPCPTQMRDLRTVSYLLGVECWYSKRFEKCCSKSSSIKCSKRLKSYWFCVLLWDKSQAGPILRKFKLGNISDAGIFLNGWIERSPEKEVFKSTVRQDDLRNHEFKVVQQDQHNLALSKVSKIFNYQQPWFLVNPPNRLLLFQLSSS